MGTLVELSNRANIDTFSFNGKRIIVYQDHRTILNVLFFALKNKIIDTIPNLIYYDFHDDACNPREKVIDILKQKELSDFSIQEINSIVEYELSGLDDDWLKTGMELGLINDAIVIGAEKFQNIEMQPIYKDIRGNNHHLYSISHLSSELGSRGCLCDTVIKANYYTEVRKLFNFNLDNNESFNGKPNPFVLDFDLDCFSANFYNRRLAWTESIFYDEFFTPVGFHDNHTTYDFVNQLIEDCEFITIAMEPDCCGGYSESLKILSLLDKFLFENSLNTGQK